LVLTFAGCASNQATATNKPLNPFVVSPVSRPSGCPYLAGTAGTSVPLPVAGFGRIATDPSNCQVFISSPGSDAIVVVDYTGKVVTTIAGEFGADAMVVRGSTLYVTLTTGGGIDAISTTKLSKIRRLASGLVSPRDLVIAGGLLWTTTGPCAQRTLQLASVDPTTGTTHLYAPSVDSDLSYCAALVSSLATPNLILAWDMGIGPGTLTKIDVSSGEPVFVQSKLEMRLENLIDLAFTPDGMRFVTASGWPYEFDEWNLAGLDQDGVIYPGGAYPIAVAVTGAGGGTMAGGLDTPFGPGLFQYALGRPAAAPGALAGTDSNVLYHRGLAFGVGGTTIFAVSGDVNFKHTVVVNLLRASST
jgi:hypothetical protein